MYDSIERERKKETNASERDKVGEKKRGNKSGRASWRTSCPVAMRTEMNYLSESQHQHTHTQTHIHTHTCIHGSAFSAGTAAEIGSGTRDTEHCCALPGKHLKNFCRTRVFRAASDSKTTADAAAETEAEAAAEAAAAAEAEAAAEQPHNRTN